MTAPSQARAYSIPAQFVAARETEMQTNKAFADAGNAVREIEREFCRVAGDTHSLDRMWQVGYVKGYRAAEADAAERVRELEAEVERLKNGAVPELAADDHVGKVIAEMYDYCTFHEEGCFGCIDAKHSLAVDGTRCATHKKLYGMIVRVDHLTAPRAWAPSPSDEHLEALAREWASYQSPICYEKMRALIATWGAAPGWKELTFAEFDTLYNLATSRAPYGTRQSDVNVYLRGLVEQRAQWSAAGGTEG